MKTIILFFLFFTSHSHAIPELNFEANWKQNVLPFYKNLNHDDLKNAQGMTLRYVTYTHPKNTQRLVILPGRTEPAIKYAELIYDLRQSGLDIFILDHQGQGESDRLLKDTQKGHVLNFKHYVRDFEQFMNEVVLPSSKHPTSLVAHSMGGAIAVKYMAKNPGALKKAVLVAPMMEINTKPYSEIVALIYAKFLMSIGKGNSYAPGQGPYISEDQVFEQNILTHSRSRFEAGKYLFDSSPDIVVSGPTARWIYESLKATKSMGKIILKTPVLLLQAGEDEVVKPRRQNIFCKESFCKLIKFPTARHEILMENDEIRDESLREIQSFLSFKLFPENGQSIVGN